MQYGKRSWVSLNARLALGLVGILALVILILRSATVTDWLIWHGFGVTDHIRIAAYEGDVGALEWIARDRGFFQQAGLDVTMQGYVSGKEATDALRAGAMDIATASDFVTVVRSFTESDLRIHGSISYYRNKAIVARSDRGIAAGSDLKGKRIGVTSPSSAEYSLYVFLALHGLDIDDATIVKLPPKQIVEAISDGNLDAAITWEPHVQAIQKSLGEQAATFQGEGFDAYLLLLSRKDWATANARALKRLIRALVLAEEWAHAYPDEAKRYLATQFKLAPAYVEALWPRMELRVTLPQELLATMDGQARWLARRGGQQNPIIPNYASFVNADALKTVRPSSVSLITANASRILAHPSDN